METTSQINRFIKIPATVTFLTASVLQRFLPYGTNTLCGSSNANQTMCYCN